MFETPEEEPISNVVPLSMFKLEQLLQSEIAERADGCHVNVRMLDDVEAPFPCDSDFLNGVVEQVVGALGQRDSIPVCDFLHGTFRCHSCAEISKGSDSDCETYVSSDRSERNISRGSSFKIDAANVSAEFYLRVNEAAQDSSIHVLEGWWCSKCSSVNWAELVVEEERVRSLWSVEINPTLLERVNFISSEIVEFVAERDDRPAWSLTHEEILEVLKTL